MCLYVCAYGCQSILSPYVNKGFSLSRSNWIDRIETKSNVSSSLFLIETGNCLNRFSLARFNLNKFRLLNTSNISLVGWWWGWFRWWWFHSYRNMKFICFFLRIHLINQRIIDIKIDISMLILFTIDKLDCFQFDERSKERFVARFQFDKLLVWNCFQTCQSYLKRKKKKKLNEIDQNQMTFSFDWIAMKIVDIPPNWIEKITNLRKVLIFCNFFEFKKSIEIY